MTSSILRATAVAKVFPDGTRALDRVDLAVSTGETVALVGESGSGKTTLLRLFNRMEEPTSGTVEVDGDDVATLDPVPLRRRIGYVQQEAGLLPHWSVFANVELVPRLLGWPGDRRRERAREVMAAVRLEPDVYGPRLPGQLSGGQRQRVALARALAADPAIILMDEPFGALDAVTRLEIEEEFLELRSRLEATLVLVTHDLGEAFRMADRVGVMHRGRLVQVGIPKTLEASPATEYVEKLLTSHLRRRGRKDEGERAEGERAEGGRP